ncbi:MAG: PTS mannitol transporter subunit IICBA [[Pasteurella] aerogenes]|nr:PTS mannitol transporter subunit IICBA [[Pasteurella] aerogenes]
MLSANTKLKVQSFGRFLSNMVMPNIGAFIAWGFITALFIPTGWFPNETLAKLVGPMITYLLPLLIGYTGGKLVGGDRGAVVGAITTAGVVIGTDIPMFLGAMIAGPTGGWAINKFDKWADGKIKSGFEMLVNNFSSGIIGMVLAIVFFWIVGPAVTVLSKALAAGVDVLVQAHLLPLTSIFVEPAKILFLNNAINHGIFSPLGIQQSQEIGHSIFFLIEANPGPGLGILLAYIMFGRGSAKQTAGGAAVIHFLGGIHEIYFPYVLMNPRLLLAVIAGGATGVFTLVLFNVGLIAPASPGSIIAVLAMTPSGSVLGVLTSVVFSCLVSFVIASFFLKIQKEDTSDKLAEAQAASKAMKVSGSTDAVVTNYQGVRKIFVSCDAGMGSSAMGASMLRKKIKDAGLPIDVANCAINDLPDNARLVITHQDLTLRAKKQVPNAMHLSLQNFLDNKFYDSLVSELKAQSIEPAVVSNEENIVEVNGAKFSLSKEQIFLGLQADNKYDAIRFAGEQLVKAGFVLPSYVDAMFAREDLVSTYLGEGLAVPHGTIEAKDAVLKTGIVVCQYSEGVRFTDEEDGIAKLVIGIAARNNEHVQVLTAITNALDSEEAITTLTTTQDIEKVLSLLKA